MRNLAVGFVVLYLGACISAAAFPGKSQTGDSTQVRIPDSRKASTDSVVEFLLTSAANDFHHHGPFHTLLFRNAHVGHMIAAGGEVNYILCGEFLPVREGTKAEWTPFVTIKTSGYEQYIGAQSAVFCESSSVVWDKLGDVASLLQSKFDALK